MEVAQANKRSPNFNKGKATRAELLLAAKNIFARDGYMNCEVNQIAAEAGKGKGTFYIYFESKNHLLQAMIEEFLDELRGEFGLQAPTNPPEQVRHVLRALWSSYQKHSATHRALVEAAVKYPEFAAINREIRAYAINDFVQMIETRQSQGFCQSLHAPYVGIVLETMISNAMYEFFVLKTNGQEPEFSEQIAFESLVSVVSATLELPRGGNNP